MPARLILVVAALAALGVGLPAPALSQPLVTPQPSAPRPSAPGLAAPPSLAPPSSPTQTRSEPQSIAPLPPVTPAPAGSILAPRDAEPDTSALRYYARMRQAERVKAEIGRLQRLYPNFKVPDDLYDNAEGDGGEDEEPLWTLFAADRLADLQAAVKARQGAQPGWQPSRDLARKITRKQLRETVLRFARDNQPLRIIQYVQAMGTPLDDMDIDALWFLAEAYAKADQGPQALAIYRAILAANNSPVQRAATIQKAIGTISMNDVDGLIAQGRKGADGRNEFDAIAVDIARGRIASFLKDERADDVAPADLQTFEDYARKVADPDQAALLAWYFLKRREFPQALESFKFSIARGGNGVVAHGLARTLRDLGKTREAEEVAYAWRDALINNSIFFIDILESVLTRPTPPFVEPERLARYGQVTVETASGEGAQALAWYAYNTCQFDVALQWFQRAMAWFPKEGTAFGYALTLERLKRRKDEFEIINRYDGLFPKVVGLVFPEQAYRPPSPCDPVPRATPGDRRRAAEAPAQGSQAYLAPGGPPGTIADATQRITFGRVPMPGASGTDGPVRPPAFNRNEFPVSTNPENPLRFAAALRPAIDRAQPAVPPASALAGRFAREPSRGPWPVIARRVPGVGPMPYERFGYTLLPAWNGTRDATWPPASAQNAPAGTLWAAEWAAAQAGLSAPIIPSTRPPGSRAR